jgi:hypothetical protein
LKNIIAFIDEFGTNSLAIEKQGVTSHYILCATLIKEENLAIAREQVQLVRKKFFQNSEIKSSGVKNKHHARRLNILIELNKIDFSVYIIVVDKKEVDSQGLNIKTSFYKYFNKEIVKKLNQVNRKIVFVADNIGGEDFRESLKKHIKKNVSQIDLFNENKVFEFRDSKEEDLIQLSDFIVGSLSKYYNEKNYYENSTDYLNLLKDKLNVNYWPNKFSNYTREINGKRKTDQEISQLALNSAESFIINNEHKQDFETISKVHILKYLILLQQVSPFYFIQTHEIIDKLKRDLNQNFTIRQLRKNIIGSLRDENVIICSSNAGGYKLPVNTSDLSQFVNRYNGIIQPMLSRMKKCRENILLGSMNEIDILDYPEYRYLKQIIETEEKL